MYDIQIETREKYWGNYKSFDIRKVKENVFEVWLTGGSVPDYFVGNHYGCLEDIID